MSALLQRGLTGGVLIAVILALRGLLSQNLPKRTFRALWSIALLHLLLPKLPHSPLSLYNLGEWLMGRLHPGAAVSDGAGKVIGFAVAPGAAAAAPLAMPAEKSWLPLVWLAGAALCAAWFLCGYIRTKRRFRAARPVCAGYAARWYEADGRRRTIALRESPHVTTPLACGLLRPTILLPEGFGVQADDTVACVLLHEELHLRRGDLWLKAGLAAAACLYWFSPLSWVMLSVANRDIELACDEAVLSRLGIDKRSGYAMALIRMEAQKSGWQMLASGFAGNALEARIKAIMKAKNYTRTAIAAAVVLCLCVTVGFAAAGEPTVEDHEPAENSSPVLQAVEGADAADKDIGAQLQSVIAPDGTEVPAEPELEPECEPEAEPCECPELEPEYEHPETEPEAEPEAAQADIWYWPVPVVGNDIAADITGQFGARIHPITGEKMVYDHITIAASKDILAAQDGKVMDVFFDSYSGNTIVLEHAGYVTMYGHLAEVSVKVGEAVKGGQVIGQAGRTGQATGDCLAFWVSQNGTTVDPLQFYSFGEKSTEDSGVQSKLPLLVKK